MISQIVWNNTLRLTLALISLGTMFSQTVAADDTWPRNLDFDHGVIQLYEPEIEKFEGNRVEALAAVAIKMGATGPVFAAISFSAISESAPTSAFVTIHDIELTELHFGEGVDQHPGELVSALEQELGNLTLTIEQSHRIASSGAEIDVTGVGVKSEPVHILYRTVPSVLVALDGEPKLQAIENSDLSWVANSTYPMLYQLGSYYLLIGTESGYRSTSPHGPWTQVAQLPANIRNLFNQAGPDSSELDVPGFDNPDIIVATEPTELLFSEGIPAWAPLAGMQLLYMTNTDSDIFLDLQSGRHYVLLQGRWYTGLLEKTGSTWLPANNDALPAAFGDIDVLSPKSHVLAFVDGTPQARAALLENKLPQGKAVPRNDTSFEAEWDGEPVFETVEQNDGLEYAINTPDSVFRVGDSYYACEDGVWYESTSAFGPWWIAVQVPDIIYEIPPSNPQHRVTYARIYDVTPEVVYAGYTPGYLNYYGYHGSVVFGSGWRYQPWYGSHYYSHHNSFYGGWGYQSYYNPWLAWAYVDANYRPNYYRQNHNRYGNSWYNRSRQHRRTAGHHNDYRNDHWRDSDDRNQKGSKNGRHRFDDKRGENHTASNNRYTSDRSTHSNSRERNRNQAVDRPNSRNGARYNTRNAARSNRTRSDVAVAQDKSGRATRNNTRNSSRTNARDNRSGSDVAVARDRSTAAKATSRAKRGRYQTSGSPQSQTSRPGRVRSEGPKIASSDRRGPTSNGHVNSGQRSGRPSLAARVPDRTNRSANNQTRREANPTVASYSANTIARSPAANSKPQRQKSAKPLIRSHDRGSTSRKSEPGSRRNR
jgi:hypothetical protein